MKLTVTLTLILSIAVAVSQVFVLHRIASVESTLNSKPNTESIDRRLDALRRTVGALSSGVKSAVAPSPAVPPAGTGTDTGPGTRTQAGTNRTGTETAQANPAGGESDGTDPETDPDPDPDEDSALTKASADGTGEAVNAVSKSPAAPSLERRRKILEEIRSQLSSLDRNGDRKISLREFQGDPSDFLYFDRDSNGSISVHEMERVLAVEEKAAERVAAGDRDRDGALSPAEFRGSARGFRFIDENADGRIAPQELVASHHRVNERFSSEDLNRDRKINPAEFSGGSGRFEKFDKNKDGVIDRSELKDMMERGY